MPVWTLRPGEAWEDELFHQKVTIDIGVFLLFFSDENGVDDQWWFHFFFFHSYTAGK